MSTQVLGLACIDSLARPIFQRVAAWIGWHLISLFLMDTGHLKVQKKMTAQVLGARHVIGIKVVLRAIFAFAPLLAML